MKPSKTLLFIVAVIAALALVCIIFPKNGISIAGIRLKMPTISHILAGNTHSDVDMEGMDRNRQTQAEKMLYAQLKDKMLYYYDYINDSSRGIALPNNDAHFFDDFFARAENAAAEGKVVRILHYGDSQIEMDRMSDVLRAYMQETFGGLGVGLIPFSQTIPCTSVSQNSSGDFTRYASYGDSTVARNNGHYGPMAKCCRVNSSASVSINATKSDSRDEHLKSFSKITVLFDNLSGNVAVTLSCKGFADQQTSNETGVHSISWQLDSAVTSARVSVSGLCDVYGIMVDGEKSYENPNIKNLTFNINGKYYPREAVDTLEDVRSRNLTLDALNCNRSLTTQIPKDLHTSIQPYTIYYTTTNGSSDLTANKLYNDGDHSNYMLGIPFADSDDFMGGISTANATIQIQMTGDRQTGFSANNTFGQPTMIITQDCLLKIWGFKSSTRKQMEITHETIEQIALTV